MTAGVFDSANLDGGQKLAVKYFAVAVVVVFFFNVAATFMKGRFTGIAGVLTLDLVALAGLYLTEMFYAPNISINQYWWWVIHLWGKPPGRCSWAVSWPGV
jgi:nitric oxide reductase large subunit